MAIYNSLKNKIKILLDTFINFTHKVKNRFKFLTTPWIPPIAPSASDTTHLLMIKPPKRIPREQHILSRKVISKQALKVLYHLHDAGYTACLVGGGVRDALLGRKPKDFDVVTDAHPEVIKSLFPNCRLVGRRFPIAHVYYGREFVEVATFRAYNPKPGDRVLENGQIIRDNAYGTMDEDTWRRDFTINALYYDISDYHLVDYVDGMADLQAGIIRLIGAPVLRYQEDPVRMLRAVRFAAKLDFTIETETANPIFQLSHLLHNIPPARLYEEVLKLFLSGHGLRSFEKLKAYELFNQLFAQTAEQLEDPFAVTLVEQALINTDNRVAQDKPVIPGFLFVALLWAPMKLLLPEYLEQGISEQEALLMAGQKVVTRQNKQVFIPKRVVNIMQDIWMLQPRLTRRKDKRCFSVLQHPRFRAGYDFLQLRAQAGETELENSVQWWMKFQQMTHQEKVAYLEKTTKPRRKRKRKQKTPPENV